MTPEPIFAPYIRNKKILTLLIGKEELKQTSFAKYQHKRLNGFAPVLYQELLNLAKLVLFILQIY